MGVLIFTIALGAFAVILLNSETLKPRTMLKEGYVHNGLFRRSGAPNYDAPTPSWSAISPGRAPA